jgi:nucleotide-binding universal stress UspA family protein
MIERRPLEHVLVATDFSDQARRAVERAARLPLAPGGKLELLHVMPRLHPSFFTQAEQQARAILDEWVEQAGTAAPDRVTVSGVLDIGEAAVEIVEDAEERGAELIVLGRHGRHPLGEAVLGTTTERVLRRGRTPVLMVAGDGTAPYRRPLVGVDLEGSEAGAVATLARLLPGETRGALAVHVLSAEEVAQLRLYRLAEPEIAAWRRSREDSARRKLETALDAIGNSELDFELELVEGDPRSTLNEAAARAQADLIVVGTHGRTGFRHLLFGSVAEAVIRGASTDVLIAPAR